jgi:phosphate/sulfate permease
LDIVPIMVSNLDFISLGLAGVLGMVVAGNNLGSCIGPLIGSGMVSRRTGTILAIIGYLTGLIVEGPKLSKITQIFLPVRTSNEVFTILVASFLIFLVGEFFKIPLSLSKALTGAILGVAVSMGFPIMNTYLVLILSFWILAPIAVSAIGVLLIEMDQRLSPKNLWRKLTLLKTGLFIV